MELLNSLPLFLFSLLLLLHHAARTSAHRSTYIIHMDKSSMPKVFSTHHHWYSSTLQSIKSVHQTSTTGQVSDPKLIYTYDHAFHGFTASMSKDELETLKKFPGFISAYLDDIVIPDTTHSYKFLGLNTATGLWPASQYGKDVIIGVVDTGIWPESPSFKDDGMTSIPSKWKGICQSGEEFNSSLCNKKLIGARYFNEGVRAANPGVNITMNSARDDSGHGTHVASTAAGNYVDGVSFFGYAPGTARGVAPRARLAAYKVLWNEGSYESDALAGIDQAVADGVDILSISLSYRRTDLYENPIAIAGFGAREKGILVSVSAGNRGPNFATLLEGIPWVFVVASGTIDRWFAGTLTLGNGRRITAWTMFPARATVRNLPLVYNETLSACSSSELLAEAPDQSIVVCNITDDSTSLFFLEIYLSESNNIRAAIIISRDTRILRSTSFPQPGVVITPEEAREVIDYASSTGTPRATIDFQQTVIGTEPRAAPALSGSSSRGPARAYPGILKPDIMAPGVLILAAYNPYTSQASIGRNIFLSGDYTLLSGTSMACPHISGIAALLKAAHPEWSPAAIQSAIMTTANPLDNTNERIKDMDDYDVATPLGVGAGQVDPNRALDPGLVYDATIQDYVNLVCAMGFTREQTQTIVRSSYNCSNPSSDLNYPSFIALDDVRKNRTMLTRRFTRTVTNVGNGAATYRVKVERPQDSTVRVSPQALVFRNKLERQSYTLTIRYRSSSEFSITHGSVTWIEENGKHTVRSPIVVSPTVNND